jgi:hypothetical protein
MDASRPSPSPRTSLDGPRRTSLDLSEPNNTYKAIEILSKIHGGF